MAMYHYSVKIGSRSRIANSLARSARITAQKLVDPRSGEIFDFSKRKDIVHHQICAPKDAPKWVFNSQDLWLAVELSEKRTDSQLYREIHIAIPFELSFPQSKKLATHFTQWLANTHGTAAEMSMTRDGKISAYGREKAENEIGYHMRIMESMRVIGPDGFGEKAVSQLVFYEKEAIIETKRRLFQERAQWAKMANSALKSAGLSERIDHRTLVAQGILRDPRPAPNSLEAAMHRRGVITQKLTAIMDGHRHSSLDKEIELLAKEARKLDRQIRKKAREERYGRLRATAISTITADVRTTGGHLEESARLSAADGYFDRVIKLAATRNRQWRAERRARATRLFTSRVVPEIELALTKIGNIIRLMEPNEHREVLALITNSAKAVEETAAVLEKLSFIEFGRPTAISNRGISTADSLSKTLINTLHPPIHRLVEAAPLILSIRIQREARINPSLDTSSTSLVNKVELGDEAPRQPNLYSSPAKPLADSKPSSRLEAFFIEELPDSSPSLEEQERLVDEWVREAIARMGSQPDPIHSSGVFIGRVLERCEGAFVQALGFDGRYTIHRTPFPPEVGDLVTVELRSGVSTINVRHRFGHQRTDSDLAKS